MAIDVERLVSILRDSFIVRALVKELIEATTARGVLPPQVLLNSHSPALVSVRDSLMAQTDSLQE